MSHTLPLKTILQPQWNEEQQKSMLIRMSDAIDCIYVLVGGGKPTIFLIWQDSYLPQADTQDIYCKLTSLSRLYESHSPDDKAKYRFTFKA